MTEMACCYLDIFGGMALCKFLIFYSLLSTNCQRILKQRTISGFGVHHRKAISTAIIETSAEAGQSRVQHLLGTLSIANTVRDSFLRPRNREHGFSIAWNDQLLRQTNTERGWDELTVNLENKSQFNWVHCELQAVPHLEQPKVFFFFFGK